MCALPQLVLGWRLVLLLRLQLQRLLQWQLECACVCAAAAARVSQIGCLTKPACTCFPPIKLLDDGEPMLHMITGI